MHFSGSRPCPKTSNRKKRTGKRNACSQSEWQEGAGGLLLLAAAHQTGLLTQLQTALSPSLLTIDPSLRLARTQPAALPCLPDGRRPLFRVQGTEILRLDAQEQAVA